ncbi:general secretion pathway protein M [Bradyrhizobium sp. F1.13.1]
MNQNATLQKLLAMPTLAAGSYLCAMALLLFVVVNSAMDLLSQHAGVVASRAMLEQFENHKPAAREQGAGTPGPAGSPFLEGATVTIAGAALLQRVTSAVSKLGGNVLSSQIDLQGTPTKTGFLTIIASCDIDQVGLQQLLYDLEAGQPFLFIDQLSVQAPANFASPGDSKLRVLLGVSGQWQGAKS